MEALKYAATVTVTVFGLFISNLPTMAQSDENQSPRWIVACNNQADENRLICVANQNIVLKKTGQRIVKASIRNIGGSRSLLLTLPLGLDLGYGVHLSVDDRATIQHSFNTADANGIYANVGLTDDFFNIMKDGKNLNVQMKGTAGREISVKLTLKGLVNAIKLMETR